MFSTSSKYQVIIIKGDKESSDRIIIDVWALWAQPGYHIYNYLCKRQKVSPSLRVISATYTCIRKPNPSVKSILVVDDYTIALSYCKLPSGTAVLVYQSTPGLGEAYWGTYSGDWFMRNAIAWRGTGVLFDASVTDARRFGSCHPEIVFKSK